ncbi:MAG: MerR family transcriptional regulator [Alphaproteobacteria bacterium]|nr:MerR family transcriptional regulator [Alphaproteobacteria bacterium]MCD8571273.1 MerR family transcriptional regulator [Alphaproteobacteria bacterium]
MDSAPEQNNIEPPATKKATGAFRTISEVADELGVQQHVLRFWETKFSQIRPLKRGGGRRYYRPEDVELLKRIYELLYTEGYTIKGVQKLMRQQGKNSVLAAGREAPAVSHQLPAAATVASSNNVPAPEKDESLSPRQKAILESMLGELRELRKIVRGE